MLKSWNENISVDVVPGDQAAAEKVVAVYKNELQKTYPDAVINVQLVETEMDLDAVHTIESQNDTTDLADEAWKVAIETS